MYVQLLDVPVILIVKFAVLQVQLFKSVSYQVALFLNQARAWFLIIDPVRIVSMRVCVCVCVSAPEAINN